MKLAQLLARELESWPDCISIAQDDDGRTWQYGGIPNRGFSQWLKFEGGEEINLGDELYCPKATDHKTAIITREQWQAERDKLAKPKANKDGWIRHRGGKCPVEKGQVFDVRLRDGTVVSDVDEIEEFYWTHTGEKCYWEIMAYRVVEAGQAEIPKVGDTYTISGLHGHKEAVVVLDYKQTESLALHHQAIGRVYRDNPIAWRDRILELDREQTTADFDHKAATDARSAEKAELVGKLKAEGLALISEPIKEADSAQVDMNDCRDRKVGDLVEITGSTNKAWLSRAGKVGPLCLDGDKWYVDLGGLNDWYINDNTDIKFHSRPTKE